MEILCKKKFLFLYNKVIKLIVRQVNNAHIKMTDGLRTAMKYGV